MPSPSQTQALLDARSKLYGAAFNSLDAKDVVSWHDDTTVFNDITMDEYNMSRTAVHEFFAKNFPMMGHMRILEDKTSGTMEFCVWEMLLEVEYRIDEPKMGIAAGHKAFVRGVAVQEWRWMGDGEHWAGGSTEEEVRSWKIVGEHDYMVTLKDGSEGASLRLFWK